MLGLPKGELFLCPWTDEWEQEFLVEQNKILELLHENIVDIHHIGSTSVKYLSAKPIIDIAIELENFVDGLRCVAPLQQLGYSYKGTNILPDRHYFSKGEPRTHQIHMYEAGSSYLLEQLSFRDYLRMNESDRIQYEELKIKLSKLNQHNKHKYSDEKTSFVTTILQKVKK